jgi:hypothetical protein
MASLDTVPLGVRLNLVSDEVLEILLDAGIFIPDLLAEGMPPEVLSLHAKSRASVGQDAIIAHEFEEGVHGIMWPPSNTPRIPG